MDKSFLYQEMKHEWEFIADPNTGYEVRRDAFKRMDEKLDFLNVINNFLGVVHLDDLVTIVPVAE